MGFREAPDALEEKRRLNKSWLYSQKQSGRKDVLEN